MLKESQKKRISQRVRVAANFCLIRLRKLLYKLVTWGNFDLNLLTFKIKARSYSFKNAIDNHVLWSSKIKISLGTFAIICLILIFMGTPQVLILCVTYALLWIQVSPLFKSGFERFESSDIVRALILDDHAHILEFHKDKVYNNQLVQLNWPISEATKSYKLQDLADIANSVRIKSLFTFDDSLRVKLQVFRKLSIDLDVASANRILSYLVLRDFQWLTAKEMVQTKLLHVGIYHSDIREVVIDSPNVLRLNRIINERLDSSTYLTASYKKYCDYGLLKKYLDRQTSDTKHSADPYAESDIENQIVPAKKTLAS